MQSEKYKIFQTATNNKIGVLGSCSTPLGMQKVNALTFMDQVQPISNNLVSRVVSEENANVG